MYKNFARSRQEPKDKEWTDRPNVQLTGNSPTTGRNHFLHIFSKQCRLSRSITLSLHILSQPCLVRGYYISQKLSMVRTLETRCGHGDSLRFVGGRLGVDPSQLRRWKSQKHQFEAFLQRGNGTRVNTAALTLHRGGKSSLHEIEDSLLQYIFEEREQGLAVSIRMVLLKAS
jgi:hypothetical protein